MASSVVILADDLTGAGDAAAPFAAAGRRTRVCLEPEAVNEAMDVVAYDLDVRDRTPEDAARRMRHLAQRWVRSSVRLFVKIDSTLRGPVVELCRAALDGAQRSLVAIVPAFPSQGRALLNGRVALGGVVATGEDANLLHRFAQNGERLIHVPVANVSAAAVERAFAGAVAERIRVVIIDAETDAQLESIAQAIADCRERVMVAGSGGIARAMAGPSQAVRTPCSIPAGSGPIIVFAGSPAVATRRQINELSRHAHTRVVRLNESNERAPTDLRDGEVLVVATCPADESAGVVRDDARSACLLAAAAGRVAAQVRPHAVVLVGGASARAVCEALGVHALDLDGEAAPGLPTGVLRGGVLNDVRVITKSGGFGGARLLRDAVRACQTRKEPA